MQRKVGQQQQQQSQSQVQYEISFPRSLQNQATFHDVYQKIMEELEGAPTNNYYTSITCLVNTSDEYFFLSQLQLLKIKYIEYGIFWFKKKLT